MDAIQKNLLEQIAGLHEVPAGAYNIRANGASVGRNTTAHIDIVTKEDKQGIDIIIQPGTKRESVHIPVVLSQSGLTEMVYNDFHVGDDCDVTIVAGCGIHNGGDQASKHDGIHSFFIGQNSHVKYVEKHYGSGDGKGERIMNPETVIHLAMLNPDPIFGYIIPSEIAENPAYNNTEDEEYLHAIEIADDIITELTRVLGAADRKAIHTYNDWN